VLLEEGTIGGGRDDKARLEEASGRLGQKEGYGCNWRQQADSGRRTDIDDVHEDA